VLPERFDAGSDGRDVDEFLDLRSGADGQPVVGEGHPHRRREAAEVGVEVVALIADDHELAGLIGGNQQRHTQLSQQHGKVRRVDSAQRRIRGRAGEGIRLA
jgi:hypothetical protein